MTEDPRRRHLTPEEAAELRRRARERRGYPTGVRRAAPPTDAPSPGRATDRPGIEATPWQDRVAGTPGYRATPRPGYQARDPRREGNRWERGDSDRRAPETGERRRRSSGERGGYARPHGSRPHTADRTRRPRPPRRAFRPLRMLALVLALLLTAGVLGVIWADSRLTRIDALTSYPGRPGATKGTVTLLVGTDGRDGLTPEQQRQLSTGSEQDAGGKRTDSMMFAYSPADGGDPLLISLPRDLLVDIPGYGENKLNAAYSFGGPQLLVQTLEKQSGVRIDHYAEIGFAGFAGIVDALGGVDVCVEQPMDDPDAGINLAPGCQVLSGPQALGFVRSRHVFAQQDLQRVRNQRILLGALMRKAASPGVLVNPFAVLPLLDEGSKALTVDSGDHIWDVVRLMWTLKNSPATATVPYDGEGSGDIGSYLQWGPTTDAFFAAIKQGRTPPRELLNPGG